MSQVEVTSPRDSPTPEACPECDTSASVTSDLHKYQVACTCKPASVQYACADDPGPPAPAKVDTPPALPPRPAPGALSTHRRNNASVGCNSAEAGSCRRRKYAWWCVGCGALAAALGGLLAAQHILLRAYTASPRHLETVPAAVPAAMLVLTGVCIMSLARRRNRYSYMIKVVGACCLVCAVTCVLVTITTTVIHMNKLQTLKFCEFTQRTRTCTCFSMPPDVQHSNDDEVRCVFEGVSSCSVVHGALYWCLRGVFALSVSAVLVCLVSCMLAYQLLSHERKKMYWEQLELRCRSLYRPPAGQGASASRAVQASCSCCSQCHPPQSAWDVSMQHRFWAPGRIGNLYSPNPGTVRKTSAWSWFPWPRSNSHNSRSCRMGGAPQSGDSAYGFCDSDSNQPNSNPNPSLPYEDRNYPSNYSRTQNYPAQGNFGQMQGNFGQSQVAAEGAMFDAATGVWGPPPPYSPHGRTNTRHHLHQDPATATLLHHHMDAHRNSALIHDHTNLQQLAMQNAHCGRNSYISHLMHPHMAEMSLNPELARLNPELARLNPELARLNPELARLNPELARLNPELARLNPELAHINPDLAHLNPELIRINPDLARLNFPADINELARIQAEIVRMGAESRFNTLRGRLVAYPACQRTLGSSLGNLHRDCRLPEENMTIECMHQKSNSKVSDQSTSTDSCQKQGKENLAFQNDKHGGARQDSLRNPNAESDVYFADGSSCCNVSLKADCCRNCNVSALVGTIENQLESTSESEAGSFTLTRQQRPQPQAVGSKRRPRTQNNDKHSKIHDKLRQELNNSIRLAENQIEQINNSMSQRFNDIRMSERVNDSRMCERMNDSRVSERMNDSTISERMNSSRISERMNDTRMSDRKEGRVSDVRMNDSRNDNSRLNDSRVSESRLNDSRTSDHSRMNESIQRLEERRMSDQHLRLELEKASPIRKNMSPSRIRGSPKTVPRDSPLHPRQSSSDSNVSHKNPEFFVPPPPAHSPLTPNTEESLLSEDDETQKTFKNEQPETSKCLGPDSQYEPVRDEKEPVLKTNHHHCYSDTNTMDSGWQSGSEKHVTD